MSCVFCTLRPEQLLAEDALTLTFRDIHPVAPGHTLVVTRRHVRSFAEVTMDEQAAMFAAVSAARARLDAELHPDGYNIGINDGEAAGQTVMHVHVHLIPRSRGDTPNPRGGIRHCIPGRGDY